MAYYNLINTPKGYNIVLVIEMTLSETRKKYQISQKEAASTLLIPLRTYIRYESNDTYGSGLKRKAMIEELIKRYEITEEKGVLTVEQIKQTVSDILSSKEYSGKIEFCYLFGSYSKGYATDKSDVDLCVSTELTGFDYFGLVEELRTKLHKKVDLVRLIDIKNNIELITELLKDGIRIYEQLKK